MSTDLEQPRVSSAVEGTTAQVRRRRGFAALADLRTFDSLREVPAFRWYLVSMTGNWSALQMQQVVRGFLAYQLTGSYAALGAVELTSSLTRVVFAVWGGVVADRASRRIVMQAGQVFNCLLALALGSLLFAEMLRYEHLIFAAMFQGISNSFTQPARQSMIPEIVGTSRLMNAMGLNVFSMNTMRLVAPALAGTLIAAIGPAWVFILMSGLYAAAVTTMFRVPKRSPERLTAGTRRARQARNAGLRATLGDVRDAFAYLRTERILMLMLVVHGFLSTLGLPYQRLLPGFVDDVMSSSPDQTALRMGLLLTMTAVGALVGALAIASLPARKRGMLIIGAITLFGLALLAFAANASFEVAMLIALVLGVGQAGRQSLNNILIQTRVADEYRGRVSSIMLLEDGVDSLGVFGIALLAGAFGVQIALGGVAAAMLGLAVVLYTFTPYRRLD